MPDELLTPEEVVAYLRLPSVETLYQWRTRSKGPKASPRGPAFALSALGRRPLARRMLRTSRARVVRPHDNERGPSAAYAGTLENVHSTSTTAHLTGWLRSGPGSVDYLLDQLRKERRAVTAMLRDDCDDSDPLLDILGEIIDNERLLLAERGGEPFV